MLADDLVKMHGNGININWRVVSLKSAELHYKLPKIFNKVNATALLNTYNTWL